MPRTGPRLPVMGVRRDPADVDAEAVLESREQGREVKRSEMVNTLIDEALTARQRRRDRKARR